LKYFRASGLSEAAAAIAAGATPLAGGTVVVPNIAATGGLGQTVVDIAHISELAETRMDDGNIYLGSMLSLAKIAGLNYPGLYAVAQAAAAVGNPQVRRAATIGGNVALGIGTADMVPPLLALDAEVVCYSNNATQELPLAEFNGAGRLITEIKIPLSNSTRSSFRKFAWRGASGITIVNVAVALSVNDGLISSARVVTGGLRQHAQRLAGAESLLEGQRLTSDLALEVASTAAAEAVCDIDAPPGEPYRRRVLAFGVKETLKQVMN
jgi:CO/xanthine dehydrogenase FAD-binding subunit